MHLENEVYLPLLRTPCEGEGLEKWMNPVIEIEAGDLRDCLDDGTTNPLWTMRGYTQVHL